MLVLPNHLGLILDGNRRWSKKHGLPVWKGHEAGAKKLEEVLEWCLQLGIKQVSVYALSIENLLERPKLELKQIFRIFYQYLKKWERGEASILDKYEVRVRFIGDLEKLPLKLRRLMGKIMQKTAHYQKKFLNLLVAYGTKFELLQTFKKLAEKILKLGKVQISEKDLDQNLLVSLPLDLVIRTGGMCRLSNFMLLQAAYAEIYVTKTLWPDFSRRELLKALRWFAKQKRNFGR